MSRKQSTGEIRVWLCPLVANISAPTVAEITAGVDVTPFMLRNGLTTPQSGSVVDSSDASSRQNKTSRGSFGGDAVTYRGFRDAVAADDDAWTAFAPGTDTTLVIRRFGGSTVAAAASQRVECWPVEVVSRAMDDIADNENQKFTVTMAVPGEVDDDALIAA